MMDKSSIVGCKGHEDQRHLAVSIADGCDSTRSSEPVSIHVPAPDGTWWETDDETQNLPPILNIYLNVYLNVYSKVVIL